MLNNIDQDLHEYELNSLVLGGFGIIDDCAEPKRDKLKLLRIRVLLDLTQDHTCLFKGVKLLGTDFTLVLSQLFAHLGVEGIELFNAWLKEILRVSKILVVVRLVYDILVMLLQNRKHVLDHIQDW